MNKIVTTFLAGAAMSVSAVAVSQPVDARIGSLTVRADAIETPHPSSLRATGNVVISGKNTDIKADEALITESNGVVTIEQQ